MRDLRMAKDMFVMPHPTFAGSERLPFLRLVRNAPNTPRQTASRSCPVARIGVLLPAYNEEPVIRGTLDALALANVPLGDIYLVDDRSTDKTAEIAKAYGVSVYTVDVNGGKAIAQRKALRHFDLIQRYDWLIFVDGDTKVDLGFINALREAIRRDPSVALYVGQVKSTRNSNIFSASRAVEYAFGHDVIKAGQNNFNVVFVAPGCASMYRTAVLAELDISFDTLAEDMDLTMQVQRLKKKIRYVPNAIVHTQDPCSLTDYHKQILRWQRGFWQVMKKHHVFDPRKRKQKVDCLLICLVLDALLFNRFTFFLLLPLMGVGVTTAIAYDIALSFAICCWGGLRTRRVDVLWKFLGFHWISYFHFYAFVRGFVEIIVLKKELLLWNKVSRYRFDAEP